MKNFLIGALTVYLLSTACILYSLTADKEYSLNLVITALKYPYAILRLGYFDRQARKCGVCEWE